ncbi:hypothetical protein ACQEVF_58005 [Nonomuraea polychroma]|uniref:hypothetical protein n=1 Tax=Nonomuraea polychroma TaxID=46176 RepID=UPI003D93748E
MTPIYNQATGDTITTAADDNAVTVSDGSNALTVRRQDVHRLASQALAATGCKHVILVLPELPDTLTLASGDGRWVVEVSPSNGARVLVHVNDDGINSADANTLAAAIAAAGHMIGSKHDADLTLAGRIADVVRENAAFAPERIAHAIVADVFDGDPR